MTDEQWQKDADEREAKRQREKREDRRVRIATAVFVNLIDRAWDREQKAVEAVLLTEALLSELGRKR